ncbi:methyltransferase domain-containing protein [Aquipuribacter sp. SD81]|uniref:methyltransferase domain-containing protein n=1 Tax=Aquipuribacter sp. SD81 TaxID=3127703 RepID=UPI0030184BCA
MQCDYYDAGSCRSCEWMGRPHDEQLADLQRLSAAALARHGDLLWEPPVAGRESGFRSKAKMVVGGSVEAPTLGILDEHRRGTDLRRCGLLTPRLAAAMPVLAELVTRARLTPYDVPARRGELKQLVCLDAGDGPAGDGGLMVRAVLRSTEAVPRLRRQLPWLTGALAGVGARLVVLSANLQPLHAALPEGPDEVVLTEARTLPVPVGDVVLHLRPQGFVQTNLEVAGALYRTAAAWVSALVPAPAVVWDLYCGAGGFALHLAGPGREVVGVEVSAESVAAASRSRDERGVPVGGDGSARFVVGDATALDGSADLPAADLVVVNPPRRGLGDALCAALERSGARHLLYSSCAVPSLARDLDALPSWRAVRGRVLDMFPQTAHQEVLVLLERR